MATDEVVSVLERAAFNLQAAKIYSLASCIMLFYDMALTFAQEVERIWTQPAYTKITWLYAVNRYVTPLGYVVIIVSFHQDWSEEVCDRYILFPEAFKIFATLAIGLIFLLRVNAIYNRDRAITTFTAAVLVAEIAVKIWAFTDGTRLKLPEPLVGCILTGRHPTRIMFTWVAELIFDTIILGLTLWRTVMLHRRQQARPMSLFSMVVRDGVIYFIVIFIANLANVLVFLLAPPDLKALNASFSTLITSLMVSRLILNLKALSQPLQGDDAHQPYVSRTGLSGGEVVIETYHKRGISMNDKGGLPRISRSVSLSGQAGHLATQLSTNHIRYELGRLGKKS